MSLCFDYSPSTALGLSSMEFSMSVLDFILTLLDGAFISYFALYQFSKRVE